MNLEIYCMKDEKYSLKYLPNANATFYSVKNIAEYTFLK